MSFEEIRVVVAGSGFAALRAHLAQVMPSATIVATEPERLRGGGAEALVLIPTMARIDAAVMDGIGGLRLIQQCGAGLEGVDLAARPSAASRWPNGASWRPSRSAGVRRNWRKAFASAARGADPRFDRGRATGFAAIPRAFLGLGGIGQALAARLRPFGMHVLGLRRNAGDLVEFLRRSEYLFLCLPLSASTRHIIGAREMALPPAGAYIINAARGGLIEPSALEQALDSGHLAGAALDVFETEPLDPDSPLLRAPGVIATPRIAGVTDVSYRDIAQRVAAKIARLCAGAALENRVV